MHPEKISVVSGYFDAWSGYWDVVMARELARLGRPVQVLASDRVHPIFSDDILERMGQARRYPAGSVVSGNLTITRLPARWEARAMLGVPDLTPELTTFGSSHVIAYNPGSLWCLGALPYVRRNRVSLSTLFPDNSAQYAGLGRVGRTLKRQVFFLTKGLAYRRIAGQSQRLYFSTPDAISTLRPILPDQPCKVMPLGYEGSVFRHDDELRRRMRAQFGWSAETPVLITAGKVHAEKKLDWLLSAMTMLPPAVQLLVMGISDNHESRRLRTLVESDAGLRTRVHFRSFGTQPELNGCFNAADIGIWPRQPAITIQQGMASGLFAVLPRNDYVGHLLRAGTGAYFPAGDRDAMVATLLDLVTTRLPVLVASRTGRVRENQWLSLEAICQDFLGEVDPGTVRR